MVKERRFGGVGGLPSQTLIVSSSDPDTILLPSGEKWTVRIQLLWALVFSVLRSSVAAKQASRCQLWPRRGDLGPNFAPASQTLIVPDISPETILVPSLSNATLRTPEPAFVDPISFRDAEKVGKHREGQLWPRRGDLGEMAAYHPKL